MHHLISSAVLALKVVLLTCGIGWTVFVCQWVKALAEISDYLAKTTHTTLEAASGGFLAEVQIYAVAFGPAALAIALLFVRWPAKEDSATGKRVVAR